MRKKTQKKPVLFSVGEEKFKTDLFGHLDGGILLGTYIPYIFKVRELKAENGQIKIDDIFKIVPPQIMRELTEDLLEQTYINTEEDPDEPRKWELLDPQEFSDYSEHMSVLQEVAKANYPHFFQVGEDTEAVKEVKAVPLAIVTEKAITNLMETNEPFQKVIQL